MTARISLSIDAGALGEADAPSVLLIGAPAGLDLSEFGATQITVFQEMMPDAEIWAARGVSVIQSIDENYDVAIVVLPRAKQAARDWIARATQSSARVLVDGVKTDGVDALRKEVSKRVELLGTISKAHGKLFWFDTDTVFEDWRTKLAVLAGGWHVAPGVFSADAVDHGSELLAAALPATLKGRVADLGAGWGYLSAKALERASAITHIDLIEAQCSALDCARQNVPDNRAAFHWADATTWNSSESYDAVIMNPPFHSGRAANVDLGRAFIATAARILRPGGSLWMVANRHLAYEQDLRDKFVSVDEIGGDNKFKLVRAVAKARKRR